MRWSTKRDQGAGPLDVNKVDLSVDCLLKEGHPVHATAVVSFRIDDLKVAKQARRVSGTQDEVSTLVHDIFVRSLLSVMETFTWDEMLKNRLRVYEQVNAASEPEMRGLGLKTDSFALRALDFPEGSVPLITIRAAEESIRRRAQEAATASTDAGTGIGTGTGTGTAMDSTGSQAQA